MNTLGSVTKTTFFKSAIGVASLTEKFEQDGLSYAMTLSTALIASNVISGYVSGKLISYTYATSGAASLTALALLIAAEPGVKSATVTTAGTVITIVPKDQRNGLPIVGFAVTGGSSQPTVTMALVDNRIYEGMPVMLMSTGKIAPCDPAATDLKCIGWAINQGERQDPNADTILPADVTVALRADAIIYAECGASSQAIGPVCIYSTTPYNATTKRNVVDDASVTVTNQIGWAMDAGTAAGDVVRVIMKK